MKMNSTLTRILSPALLALALAACGSGGDGGTTTGGNGTITTSTSLTSSGVITGFGSVFVNGIRYQLENGTVVAIEDETEVTGSEDPLRLGMKVRVRARELNDGSRVAERIEYDEDLKGQVRNVLPDSDDPAIGTFEVMGSTVSVDLNTVFDDDVGDNDSNGSIDINDLDIGGVMLVEVSGFPTPSGFLATRVDRLNPPGAPVDENEAEVKGTITGLNLPGSIELNNSLTVNIGGGTTFDEGLTGTGDLSLELFVEVKGTRVNDTEIDADEIELEDRLGDEDREGEFEIEGVLQDLRLDVEPNVVVINGLTLQVQDASALDGLVGRRIELRGEFNDNDVLVLRSGDDGVELELEENVRTRDLLREVDTEQDRLITRLGLQIQATGQSRVQDRTRDDDEDNLTVDQFITGLQGKGTGSGVPVIVEARGGTEGGGVTWTLIDVDDAEGDEECRVRGPVSEVNGSAFTFEIRDIVVNAGASDYLDETDTPTTRGQFFDALVNGQTIVQATGNKENDNPSSDCSNLSLIADEVEIED